MSKLRLNISHCIILLNILKASYEKAVSFCKRELQTSNDVLIRLS